MTPRPLIEVTVGVSVATARWADEPLSRQIGRTDAEALGKLLLSAYPVAGWLKAGIRISKSYDHPAPPADTDRDPLAAA